MDEDYYEFFNHWDEFINKCQEQEELLHEERGTPRVREDLFSDTPPSSFDPVPGTSSSSSSPSYHGPPDDDEYHPETKLVVTFYTSGVKRASSQRGGPQSSNGSDDGGDPDISIIVDPETFVTPIRNGEWTSAAQKYYAIMRQKIALMKPMKRGRGGLYEEGSITVYPGGYHIVWRGNKQGFDCLHGPDGHHYSYYHTGHTRYDISKRSAYWRCSGRIRLFENDKNKRKIYRSCPLTIHELDGTFIVSDPDREHLAIDHFPSEKIKESCPICSCSQEP